VPVTIRGAFVVQEPTTTAHVVGRASSVCLSAQPQSMFLFVRRNKCTLLPLSFIVARNK
jgi:hypothetical protein